MRLSAAFLRRCLAQSMQSSEELKCGGVDSEDVALHAVDEALVVFVLSDGQKWEEVWQAKSWSTTWLIRLIQSAAGTEKPGRKARFIKLETRGESPRPLVLRRVTVLGIK